MSPSFWAVILLAVSLALLFAEICIPSGGTILFSSIVCLILAIWNAYSAWWSSNPAMFWGFIVISIVLVPLSLFSAVSLWPYTPLGKRAEPPTLKEVTPYLEEQRRLETLVGQIGMTETPLTPSGLVRVKEQRIHCRSEGMIVPSGIPVTILAVVGNGLLVRETKASSRTSNAENIADSQEKPLGESLDFDLPET